MFKLQKEVFFDSMNKTTDQVTDCIPDVMPLSPIRWHYMIHMIHPLYVMQPFTFIHSHIAKPGWSIHYIIWGHRIVPLRNKDYG